MPGRTRPLTHGLSTIVAAPMVVMMLLAALLPASRAEAQDLPAPEPVEIVPFPEPSEEPTTTQLPPAVVGPEQRAKLTEADTEGLSAVSEAAVIHVKFDPDRNDAAAHGIFAALPDAAFDELATVFGSAGADITPLFGRDLPPLPPSADAGAADVLSTWHRITLEDPTRAGVLLDVLNAMPEVEVAYAEPALATPAMQVTGPDFTASQDYREAAPVGIDADFASTVPGGTGANTRVFDVEYAWDTAHVDLGGAAEALIPNGSPIDPFNDPAHGTAVIGIVGAEANGFGVTGIVPDAPLGLVNVVNTGGPELTTAILLAAGRAERGDVILIEQQLCAVPIVGGSCAPGWLPVEAIPLYHDAIAATVARGVIVVEAAGNGGRNLDTHVSAADTGAIIVGAGAPFAACSGFGTEPPLGRFNFSNHGNRVHLQGDGGCVWTTGTAGGGGTSSDRSQSYTGSFSGTSSAAAIVAGAAASLSSVAQEQRFPLAPSQVRSLLIDTGTPQDISVDSSHIGPKPNLAAAIVAYEQLVPPRPPNDDLSAATPLTSPSPVLRQDPLVPTVQPGEPDPGCARATATVWFEISVTEDHHAVIDLTGTSAAALWRVVPDAGLSRVLCADGDGAVRTSVPLAVGERYLLQVETTPLEPISIELRRIGSCDIDADGYGEVVIGVPGEAIAGRAGSGAVNVLFGRPGGDPLRGPRLNQNSPETAGTAQSGDGFGTSVGCGDFDGDGFADVAVGIPGEGVGVKADAGAIEVYPGSPDGLGGGRRFTQAGAVPGAAQPGARFGSALAVSDFNGDGYDDIAIGVPGQTIRARPGAGSVVVLYGSNKGLRRRGLFLHQNVRGVPNAAQTQDHFGAALSAGDVSGDGRPELAVGAPGEDLGRFEDIGLVHVFGGSTAGPVAAGSQVLSPRSPRALTDAAAGAAFGTAIAIGEVTGDGAEDLVVGAPRARVGQRRRSGGAVEIFAGGSAEPMAGIAMSQESAGVPGRGQNRDGFGSAVAVLDDRWLAVGVPGEDRRGARDGGLVVLARLEGAAVAAAAVISQGQDGVAGRAEQGDRFGTVLFARDVDGDGRRDLVVGAPAERRGKLRASGLITIVHDPAGSRSNEAVDQRTPGVAGRPARQDRFGAAIG